MDREDATYDKEKEVFMPLKFRETDIVKETREIETKIGNIKRRRNIKMKGKTNNFKILFLG